MLGSPTEKLGIRSPAPTKIKRFPLYVLTASTLGFEQQITWISLHWTPAEKQGPLKTGSKP